MYNIIQRQYNSIIRGVIRINEEVQREHKQIVDYLIDTYGAEKVEYMRKKGAQRVLIEPIQIFRSR